MTEGEAVGVVLAEAVGDASRVGLVCVGCAGDAVAKACDTADGSVLGVFVGGDDEVAVLQPISATSASTSGKTFATRLPLAMDNPRIICFLKADVWIIGMRFGRGQQQQHDLITERFLHFADQLFADPSALIITIDGEIG